MIPRHLGWGRAPRCSPPGSMSISYSSSMSDPSSSRAGLRWSMPSEKPFVRACGRMSRRIVWSSACLNWSLLVSKIPHSGIEWATTPVGFFTSVFSTVEITVISSGGSVPRWSRGRASHSWLTLSDCGVGAVSTVLLTRLKPGIIVGPRTTAERVVVKLDDKQTVTPHSRSWWTES